MTQEYLRYTRDVEREEPDFEQTLQQVLDDMKQHMRGSLKTEGIGLVVRNAHAKGYGLAWGEFEILSGMPKEYSQGIYAKPGRHEAMVRFSNGTNHVGADRFIGPITGIGLKIFGIEGKTLLEDLARIKTLVDRYPLSSVKQAYDDFEHGHLVGRAVVIPEGLEAPSAS